MAFSSSSSFLVVSLAVLLQSSFLFVSASTKSIDAICHRVTDKAFCVQTLNAYPPAASASTTFQAAQAALSLSISYAGKSAGYAAAAAKQNPNMKKQFAACQDAFVTITASLKSAASELKESPDTANYDVMVCRDSTTIVKNLVGKNVDKASKTVITMTLMMEKLLAIAVGATLAVGG
ncbi:hypothetical protein EUTSA_v10015309mg [Eutrema salsugineum]|uniref:Pectinesterase inhibitor domain-containing protein n=1 Tax=Eutrema salsugineum TaxID=72664 RepID=V4L069_EUTSA|nr:uncharacterized protein LOC18018280 [Eutrema salsugineum]ESQ43645.1 hypothetical protein EUTSA_v10015309mg [Eutrema salsugineum]